MLWLRASLARFAQKCCDLRDTGGWQHSKVIRAARGNKEPEGQIRQAISEENKSSHYTLKKKTTGECSAVTE